MSVNSTINRVLRCNSSKRRNSLFLYLVSLLMLWYGVVACPVHADTSPNYEIGHTYVNYTPDHIPAATGTTVDVTDTLSYNQDHVYDSYGNILIIDSANHRVTDSSSNVVGFMCYQSD